MASTALSTAITSCAYRKSSVDSFCGLTLLSVEKASWLPQSKLKIKSTPAKRKFPLNGSRICMSMREFNNPDSFKEDDKKYVESSIVESTEVKGTKDGFVIRMADGRQVACKHAASLVNQVNESGPQPAIVLRLEDGSGIMLPIIVLEQPAQQLKECLRNAPVMRPTVYQVMKDMAKFMGYELKLVRVTHRICEAYHARAYLSKVEEDTETIISLDMRPSDAINLAARAKVPIQVNKALAQADGVVPITVAPTRSIHAKYGKSVFNVSNADRPVSNHCTIAEEFEFVRNVTIATYLERYNEAARFRDELILYRSAQMGLTRDTSDAKHMQG